MKPREGCKLGDIYSYTVSPEAAKGALQVSVNPSNPTQYPYGPLRLLIDAYPQSKSGIGIGSSNLASLIPQGKRIQQSLQDNGIKVSALQEQPPSVPNYRPYVEQLKQNGAVGFDTINGQDITPIVQAMKNTGYNPAFILYSVQYYLDANVQAAKALGTFPNQYIGFSHLAFEMDPKTFPVLGQVKSILSDAVGKPRFTDFTASSFSAWALWAKEATACGNNLTQECVLQKAAAETAVDRRRSVRTAQPGPDQPEHRPVLARHQADDGRLGLRQEGHEPEQRCLQLRPEERDQGEQLPVGRTARPHRPPGLHARAGGGVISCTWRPLTRPWAARSGAR